MELSDEFLWQNRDWDPSYLKDLMDTDFNDLSDLWSSNVRDSELVSEVERVERYCPITEDISLDDDTLCHAVDTIEDQYVVILLILLFMI